MIRNPHSNNKENVYRMYTKGNDIESKHITMKNQLNTKEANNEINDGLPKTKYLQKIKILIIVNYSLPISALNINRLQFHNLKDIDW